MSSINWHRIKVRTWRASNRIKRICDSIHRRNNPAKNYDGHAWQYIVDIFYNEMHAAEYIDGISDKRYFFVTSQNHMDPNQIRNYPSIHFHPPLQHPSVHVFVLNRVYCQYHRYVAQRNCLVLSDVSIRFKKKCVVHYENDNGIFYMWHNVLFKTDLVKAKSSSK